MLVRFKKRCSKCKEVKFLSEFGVHNNNPDGKQYQCILCKRETSRISSKKKYWENPQKAIATVQAWQKSNPEKAKEIRDNWQRENREYVLEQKRIYRANHKDEIAAYMKDYREGNPERYREYAHKRRMLMISGEYEKIDRDTLFDRDNGICGICDLEIDKNLNWPDPGFFSIDHVIPVIKGGSHTYDNVQAAHLYCNMVKGSRTEVPMEDVNV